MQAETVINIVLAERVIRLGFLRKIYSGVSRMHYEKNNILDKTSCVRSHCYLIRSKLGYHSSLNSRCSLAYASIGNYTQLGQYVLVNPRDHIYQNFMIADDIYTAGEEAFEKGLAEFGGYQVKIGHDVWIGDRAIILSHVEIGNGAVIAAGSVVTKSVPPYAVVGGGGPARFIKWRFPEETVLKMERLAWYNWTIDKVMQNKHMLEELAGFQMIKYMEDYCARKKDMEIF